MQQDLGHWHPDLWPLQVQLQQQVSAALAQHTGKSRGERDWVTGMVWPGEGHVLKEPLPGDTAAIYKSRREATEEAKPGIFILDF